MYTETRSQVGSLSEQENSAQQISAYYLELEHLLHRVEHSSTHYQVLGLDQLSTTGEIKVAYLRASVIFNPSRFGLNISMPHDLLKRVDRAFEDISQAFSILVSFQRRLEYDEALRQQTYGASDQSHEVSLDATSPPATNTARPSQTILQTIRPARKTNRRKSARFKLSIPVLVTGYDDRKGKWKECSQTVDLSQTGVLLRLSNEVENGKVLHLTLPMPEQLRQHDYNDLRYSIYAVVRRIEPSIQRRAFVALEFLSENPPSDYFERS